MSDSGPNDSAGQAPAAPQYPNAGWAPSVRPSTGTVAWAMGFLAFIPIPFFGSIITGVVTALVGYGQRSKGEVARRNGIRAANWGLTYLLLTVLLIGGAFTTFAVSSGGGGQVPPGAQALGFTLIGLWAFPLQIIHLVLTIVGTVKASRGAVFENRFALPLLR